jgi:hypothetical protein
MAVVVAASDADAFILEAAAENLTAVVIAKITFGDQGSDAKMVPDTIGVHLSGKPKKINHEPHEQREEFKVKVRGVREVRGFSSYSYASFIPIARARSSSAT